MLNVKIISACPTLTKLDSKTNLPLLSKSTHKNSLHRNTQFFYIGMLQYLRTNHIPKASDYLHNREEIDLHSNCVTESKVTECNRISLAIFTQKSMSQDEIKSQSLLFNNVCALLVSGHISGISDKCSGKDIWRRPVHSSCTACNTNFCVRLIMLHFVTFDSVYQVVVHVNFFFVMKIITCFWACD